MSFSPFSKFELIPQEEKLEVLKIQDITKIAHGGCKLAKKRRV